MVYLLPVTLPFLPDVFSYGVLVDTIVDEASELKKNIMLYRKSLCRFISFAYLNQKHRNVKKQNTYKITSV